MKRTIKVCALHPGIKSIKDFELDFLKDEYDFKWEEETPEYVFATEVIYYQKAYEEKFKHFLNNKDTILIAAFGECISPDMNLFDYACVFDRGICYGDRIIRIPSLFRYRDRIFPEIPEKSNTNRNKFCDFIYSNPDAPEERDNLFHYLSSYKCVDSLGPHLNNVGNRTTRHVKDWAYQSIIERLPYKFSIAAENAVQPGYITEKILCCIQAGTIPIYWGDPTIGREFNEKRFINCHKYQNFDEVLNEVKRIDHDHRLWEEIASQPLQTPEQEERTNAEIRNYLDFLRHIFNQQPQEAKRRGKGYHPGLYRKWLFRENDNLFVSIREQRLKSANEVYRNVIHMKCREKKLQDIFIKHGWKRIAIYALGDIGKLLYDELVYENQKAGVEVAYAIDRNRASYKNLQVFSLKDNLMKVDQIIVTLPEEYETIKESIKKVTDIGISNILELVSEENKMEDERRKT